MEDAKTTFARLLDELEGAEPDSAEFYDGVRSVNEEYRQSGVKVLTLMEQGLTDEAIAVHLDEEHLISHRLETSMRDLITAAQGDMVDAQR